AAGAGAGAAAPAFFDARERAVLLDVVARMVDTGEPGAPAVGDTRALETIEALCLRLPAETTAPLPALLRLVEWGPLLFEGRFARFTALDPSAQDAHLAGWMRSRFGWRRLGFQALRNLAMLGYWSQEETWPLIGYRGPLLQRGQ